MTIVLTREQAYEFAWAAPLTKLAPEIGISDVMLARSLRDAAIPLPWLGYWAKLAAKKPVIATALPPPHLGTYRYVWLAGATSSAFLKRISGHPGEREQPWEDVDELAHRFKDQMPSLRMPTGWLHEGSKRLLARDERTRQKKNAAGEGLAQFYRPIFEDAQAKRRLNFANRMGFALQRVGGKLSFNDADAKSFDAHIGSGRVSFSIEVADGKLRIESRERQASGEPRSWIDDASGKLETRIAEILTALGRISVLAEREWREEVRLRRLHDDAAVAELAARRASEEARAERRALRKRQKKLVKGLVKAARGAQESELIRQYVERSRSGLAKDYPPEQVDAWAEHALAVADAVDPWKNGDTAKSLKGLAVAFNPTNSTKRKRPVG